MQAKERLLVACILTVIQVTNAIERLGGFTMIHVRIPSIVQPDHLDSSHFLRLPGWSSLSEHIPARFLANCLPGRLIRIQSARLLLNEYVLGPDFYAPFMEDIFASQNDPASSWQKGEWVCGDCALRFIKQELLSWLLRRLGEGLFDS